MEKTPGSVSVTRCISERQGNLKVFGETSCSKNIVLKEKNSCHAESKVMVECVSSTTEQSPLTAHKKLSLPSKCASLNMAPMSQVQRNEEKYMHSKTYESREASKFKPVDLCRSSLSRERDKDRKREKQHQETFSASKSDMISHAQSSVKKRIPKRNTLVDPEISSSSLVLQSRRSSFSSTTEKWPGSPTYARCSSSSSYSEHDPKSRSKHEKYAKSSGNPSISRNHAFRENSCQDSRRQKHYWQDGKMGSRGKSHNGGRSSFQSSRNRERNIYKKMSKNKIRKIKNNIEMISSKEMVEKTVKEIKSNLEKMSSDLPQSSVDSLETVKESTSQERKGCREESMDDNQLVPFLPSSRCCSPPPRPATVEKYWSDADETETESDSEKHLLHVHSVNIVLNYLKDNSQKYYVDGKKISKQRNIKHKKSKGHVNKSFSCDSYSESDSAWSKSRYSRGHFEAFTVRENQSQPPIESNGLGLSISKLHAKSRDSYSRPPSEDTDFFDRKSLHSPSRDSHHCTSVNSPAILQESSSTNRDSRSPTKYEDHRYRQSPSHKNRRGFQWDRGSSSASRHWRDRASSSPSRHRRSRSPSGHRRSRSPSGHRRSRSPSGHRRSRSPSEHRRSRSPSGHRRSRSPLRHKRSHSPLRHMRSLSPSRHRQSRSPSGHRRLRSPSKHRRSRSPSGHKRSHSRSRHRRSRSPSRHRRSCSPSRHETSSYRESYFPLSYSGGLHENRESPSYTWYSKSSLHPFTEDSLSNRGSPSWTWDAEDSLANKRLTSMLHEPHSISKQELSPESLHRYGIKRSHYSEDLCNEFMNTQKKSKTGSENYAPGKGEGAKKTLRIDKTDFVENSLSVDTRKSKRREDRTALEINTFQTDDGSNDDLIVSNIRTIINQESSCERSTLNNMKKNISQRYQQVKKENEMKLPLTFGRGAKKILRIDKTFDCVENSFSVDTRENKIREDRTASEVNAFQTDDGDDDDDEPIIDRPEDYLNTSSTMTTYRPSFVPDTHDREKLAGLAETNRLFESHEDVSVAGPSVITSLPTPDGKEQDDSSHRLSDLECDRMIENVDSAVSQVSSSSASLEPGPSGMTTSAKSDVFNLSLTFKEVTTKSAKSEEKKAVLTLNSEEMSTLLSLIELAKNHVATGKDLSSNFPQVLQTCQDASNSNATEPQGTHSGKNQQQPSISLGSTDMQDIAENENARATSLESIDMDDISNSEKNATATTESGGIIDIPESERNVRATTGCASTMHDIPESERYVRAISEAAMDDVTESERNVRAITENAAMDDITESERNVRATVSINERMKNKTKTVNYTKDVISKNECKQGAIKNIKPISCKSNIKNNKVINDGQSAKHVASRINKKIGRIPKDKTDEIILKKKKSNDHLSQSKADDKHPQSRNRGQGSKTDGKQLKIMKNPEQSSRENLDETTQELVKGKAQSPKKKKLHDVKDVSSSKKKNIQHDENSQFSKNGTKSSVFERTFKLMQSVKVDVSLSQETIALCKRVKHHQGITEHKKQKKWLKKVGKRIFMNDLSDSEDDSSSTKLEKDESPEAGKQPREMHPLYQKTSVPDHSVSVCLFCKCNLKFDELSTVSLNTGTVTLKCRNCHTYRKMEKVLSLQCYAGSPSFQNIASTASEATGTSEGNNNCEVNKKRNLTASSKQRKNENIRKKDGSLKRTHSTKQASKEKGYSQQEVNVNSVKEKKKKLQLVKKL